MSRNNEREFDGGGVELDMIVRTFGKPHRISWLSVSLIHQMLSEMETWLHRVWIGCVVFGVRRGVQIPTASCEWLEVAQAFN
jgi:hypothetical protein